MSKAETRKSRSQHPGKHLLQVNERCRKQAAVKPCRARSYSSPRGAVWLLLAYPDSLHLEESRALGQLFRSLPEVASAYQLVQRFKEMVHQKDLRDFSQWMKDALKSDLPDLETFAIGLDREREAVEAALREP